MGIEEILAALQAIVDGAQGRNLNDEEVQRYEKLEADLAVAKRSADIRSRQSGYQAPATSPLATATQDDSEALERAFEHYLRTGVARHEGVELRAQNEGTASAGGYLVPTTFRTKLVERLKAFGGIAAEAEILNTSSGNPIEWPTLDDTSNMAEIVQEGQTFSAGADVVFGTATLGAYKYMAGGGGNAPVKVSWELLQDSAFDVQALLARVFANRINRIQAVHWAVGDGSGEPLGLFNGKSAYGNIAGTSAPTYGELLATIHALDPAYRANAKWVMNDATLAAIQGIVDTTGRPLLWASTDDMASPGAESIPSFSLLGYPVVIDQGVSSIASSGAVKFLAFGDIRQAYVIRRVQDVTVVVMREMYAPNGQVGFIGWARADGTVQDPNAYVILAGKA